MIDVDDLAMARMKEIAAHYGWNEADCLYRLFNALANGSEPFDIATLLWGVDFVACEGQPRFTVKKQMFDATLPANRPADPIYDHYKDRVKAARRSPLILRRGRNARRLKHQA
jgi:hypothetical protein